MKRFILAYPLLLTLHANSFAAEDQKLQTEAVQNASNLVIRECNNVASQSDLKFMRALSDKPWTDKEKAEVLATTHNAFLQVCVLGVAAGLKKYADDLGVLTGE